MVERIENAAAAKMIIHRSSSYTWVYLILYARNRLLKTEWIISNIILEVGFYDETGLDLF